MAAIATATSTARELRELVARIAADPAQWRPLVRHGTRAIATSSSSGATTHVDVWVISWANGNDTGFHDHDVSRGAVAVVEGEVIEERLVLGGPPRRLRHRAGRGVRLRRRRTSTACTRTSDAPAVSIHAYSPPLWRMGSYAVDADGTLRRVSISYAEELRPAEASA